MMQDETAFERSKIFFSSLEMQLSQFRGYVQK